MDFLKELFTVNMKTKPTPTKVNKFQTRRDILFPLEGKPKCTFANDTENFDPHTAYENVAPSALFGKHLRISGGNGLFYYQSPQYSLLGKKMYGLVDQSPFDLVFLTIPPN